MEGLDAVKTSTDIERRNAPNEGHMFRWAMAAMLRDGWWWCHRHPQLFEIAMSWRAGILVWDARVPAFHPANVLISHHYIVGTALIA